MISKFDNSYQDPGKPVKGFPSCISPLIKLALGFVIGCLWSTFVFADHPVDVQRLSSEGDHFKALTMYELLPERRLNEDTRVAAAKSAWALGLTKQASTLFDAVLRSGTLDNDERARITLSRGVIEFQEERYQEAGLFAEKTTTLLPEKAPLRGRAFLLWGQSLVRAQVYATAEEKLLRALGEMSPADRPDAALALGSVQIKLGRLTDAERSLKTIPASHAHASEAIRMLAAISIQTKQNERARFWIEKGKANYSDAFLDSWPDYGLTKVAIEANDMPQARRVVEKASQRFPPSDPWLILMKAALEQAEWSERAKGYR
jgi:tetratricopeptide (TPR) repeat protein